MKSGLHSLHDVATLIHEGKKLIIAGDEALLQQLPSGCWIAGTTPYFMANDGGIETKNLLFVHELPPSISDVQTKEYSLDSIKDIYTNTPTNGFTILILPATSSIHASFAMEAPHFDGFATRPVIGWISGVKLAEIGHTQPKVFLGEKNKKTANAAVAMHVTLPANMFAEVHIINLFTQGNGDVIMFPENGFSTSEAIINGKTCNFAKYIEDHKIDTRLPLVADYSGADINISFQSINVNTQKVTFYAPVFKGVEYKLANPIGSYSQTIEKQINAIKTSAIAFSCNCILNYVYGELEGKKTANITGPITFGEIAYQLLNQTLTYLNIESHE